MSDTQTTQGGEGRITRVIGPVVDVAFPPGTDLPDINHALTFERETEGRRQMLTAEVAQHIGEHQVRAIVMQPTDGVVRGTIVTATGSPITVPVGPGVLGHVYNVLGRALDVDPDSIQADTRWAIHRDSPKFEDLEPQAEM